MQNTENTILENWQGPQTTERPHKPVYHFALRQTGISIDFHLERFFTNNNIKLHYFQTFEELIVICQRYEIDIIILAGGPEERFIREMEMVKLIKRNTFLAIVPVILFHTNPDENIVIAAYQAGAEDFIHGDWKEKLIEVRINKVIERSRRDMSINPSTHLPGPSIIEHEMTKLLSQQAEFAVCYADLDNFKAYNDYYGYFFGDKIIRLTARIIKDIVFDVSRGGFVGHIAGDDFICIIPKDDIDFVCRNIIKTFDSLIRPKYKTEDLNRGYIETTNRSGTIEKFPILTISIAVLINELGSFTHVGEMSKMLADLKKATKLKSGSNYMIERRSKY